MSKPTSPTFASLVQEFFTDYMVQQRALSPRTVASYRDTFVLLLRYAQQQWQGAEQRGADRHQREVPGSASLITWSRNGTTRCAAATSGWPRCARS